MWRLPQEGGSNGDDLLSCLGFPVNDLRDAGAQRAMVIQAGILQDLGGQKFQLPDGVLDMASSGLHLVEKSGQCVLIHGLWGRNRWFSMDLSLSLWSEAEKSDPVLQE
jgi:hypothetical protein